MVLGNPGKQASRQGGKEGSLLSSTLRNLDTQVSGGGCCRNHHCLNSFPGCKRENFFRLPRKLLKTTVGFSRALELKLTQGKISRKFRVKIPNKKSASLLLTLAFILSTPLYPGMCQRGYLELIKISLTALLSACLCIYWGHMTTPSSP